MKSLERQPILVEKGLTVSQNFLFVIIPSFVAYLKKSPLTFSFKELHLFLVLLYEIEFSLDGQFKFVFFFALDLVIIHFLRKFSVFKRFVHDTLVSPSGTSIESYML